MVTGRSHLSMIVGRNLFIVILVFVLMVFTAGLTWTHPTTSLAHLLFRDVCCRGCAFVEDLPSNKTAPH
jgi:hypothetical protein